MIYKIGSRLGSRFVNIYFKLGFVSFSKIWFNDILKLFLLSETNIKYHTFKSHPLRKEMLSALRRMAFFVSGVTSIARISMEQKMTKRSKTKRQHFFAGTP